MNQLGPSFAPVVNLVRKHHPVLFISFIGLLLATAIFFLYQVLAISEASNVGNTTTITQFDQKTIDEIKKLHDSSDTSSTLVFPTPRSNPFVE